MAKAKYWNGSSYVNWSADMVNGFDMNGNNRWISLTHDTATATGFRCVLDTTLTALWREERATYAVASRHAGTGIVSLGYYNKDSTDIVVSGVHLTFNGTASNMYTDAWTAIVNANNIKLYCRMQDYNNTYLACLESYNMTAWKNGSWVTSLPAGTKIPVNINSKQIYVQSSQPPQSDCLLWVQI